MSAGLLRREAAPPPPLVRWKSLFEFLVVGGATLLLVPLSWAYQAQAGAEQSIYVVSWVAFYAAYAINDPHFAVTYFLFYKNARQRALGREFSGAQRIRYLVAGLGVPVLLGGWAAWGLATDSPKMVGLMIQLMFFTVGWHYVKQGFGVLTVLSARRGKFFEPIERRVILFHCFAGWGYGWASPAGPGSWMVEDGVIYKTYGMPAIAATVSEWVFWISAVSLVVVLARKWYRGGVMPPLVPLSGLLISVWLWTVYAQFDPLVAYAIPALHSIQYLYFVWLLKRGETKQTPGPRFLKGNVPLRLGLFALTVLGLGWLLFHGGPGFLDESFALDGARLGPTPYLAAIGTFVNIHHYFMDHVIWRRENPETRFMKA